MREGLRSAGLVEREGLWRDPSDMIGAVASPVGIFVGWIDLVWAGPAYCEPRLRDVVHVPPVNIDSDLGAGARPVPRHGSRRRAVRCRYCDRHHAPGYMLSQRRLPGVRAWRRLLIAAIALCALGAPATAAAAPAQVRDYNLGRVELADPSPFGSLPIRLWGALGVPTGPGPHPLVRGRPRPSWHGLPERRGGQRDVALLQPRAAQRPRAAARRRGARAARDRRDRAGPERRLHRRLGRAERPAPLAAHRQPHARCGRARGRRWHGALPDLAERSHRPRAARLPRSLAERSPLGARGAPAGREQLPCADRRGARPGAGAVPAHAGVRAHRGAGGRAVRGCGRHLRRRHRPDGEWLLPPGRREPGAARPGAARTARRGQTTTTSTGRSAGAGTTTPPSGGRAAGRRRGRPRRPSSAGSTGPPSTSSP